MAATETRSRQAEETCEQVDEDARALIFIHSVAHGASDMSAAAWPPAALALQVRFGSDDALGAVLAAIIRYKPAEWREGHCAGLRTLVQAMWRTALYERALFGRSCTFATLLMYYSSLNHHAETQKLTCAFHVSGASHATPALLYRDEDWILDSVLSKYIDVRKRNREAEECLE
jgi:hypothetical protein